MYIRSERIYGVLLFAVFLISTIGYSQNKSKNLPNIDLILGTPIYWGHARPLSLPRNDLQKTEWSAGLRLGTSWNFNTINSQLGIMYGRITLHGYKEGVSWGPLSYFTCNAHELYFSYRYSLNNNMGFYYSPFSVNAEIGVGGLLFQSQFFKYPNFTNPISSFGYSNRQGENYIHDLQWSHFYLLGISFNYLINKHWYVSLDNTLQITATKQLTGIYPNYFIHSIDAYSFNGIGLHYMFNSTQSSQLNCPKGLSYRKVSLRRMFHR